MQCGEQLAEPCRPPTHLQVQRTCAGVGKAAERWRAFAGLGKADRAAALAKLRCWEPAGLASVGAAIPVRACCTALPPPPSHGPASRPAQVPQAQPGDGGGGDGAVPCRRGGGLGGGRRHGCRVCSRSVSHTGVQREGWRRESQQRCRGAALAWGWRPCLLGCPTLNPAAAPCPRCRPQVRPSGGRGAGRGAGLGQGHWRASADGRCTSAGSTAPAGELGHPRWRSAAASLQPLCVRLLVW